MTKTSSPAPPASARAVAVVDRVSRVFMHLTVVSLLVTLLALTMNVILRYWLTSASGLILEFVQGDSAFQLARVAVVMIIFGGLPEVTRKGTHIRIGILPERVSPRWRKRLDVLNVLATAAIFVIFTWACARYALNAYRFNSTIGSHPEWPVWPIASFMATGLGLSVLVALTRPFVPVPPPAPTETVRRGGA